MLLREERRERKKAERRLAECRRELHQALAPLAPDSATILELSVKERLLLEQQHTVSDCLEQRIAGLLGPEQAMKLRTLAPLSHASAPAQGPLRSPARAPAARLDAA